MRIAMAAAALALVASGALAEPGGKGGGEGKGGGNHAAHGSAGGGGKSNGNGHGGMKHDRGSALTQGNSGKAQGNGAMRKDERKIERRIDNRAERRIERSVSDMRGGREIREVRDRIERSAPVYRDVDRVVERRVQYVSGNSGPLRWSSLDGGRRYFDGCPPGLAKKNNGCMPPGLAKAMPAREVWYTPRWYGNDWSDAGSYRYYDGYMLRMGNGGSIASYIPLLAGALAVGEVWPGAYQPVSLPDYYTSYYDLGAPGDYRYYDDTIYRVDPQTQLIQSVAALLTGEDIGIGQPMPAGYEIYNVPYTYRSQYVDGPDALYRYNDGYVYRIDPTTQLVQAAIELLI